MAIGDVSVLIRDNALGLSQGGNFQIVGVMGPSSTGDFEWAKFFGAKDLAEDYTSGPLLDNTQNYLDQDDVDQLWVRRLNWYHTGAITRTAGTGTGTIASTGSVPTDDHDISIEITTQGDIGTAVFRYKLRTADDWTSDVTTTAVTGINDLGEGVVVTFTGGSGTSFKTDDRFSGVSKPNSTASAVTKTAAGETAGTLALTGSYPHDAFELKVKITKTGLCGIATFQYSLDNGAHYSDDILTPSSGTAYTGIYDTTGLKFTFTDVSTGFTADDLFDATTSQPTVLLTHIETALQEMFDSTEVVLGFCHIMGDTDEDTLDSIDALLVTGESTHSYMFVLVEGRDYDSGTDSDDEGDYATNVKDELATGTTSKRILITHGYERVDCNGGRRAQWRSGAWSLGPRMAAQPYSHDPGRVAAGALGLVSEIGWDARLHSEMNSAGFTVSRTYDKSSGFYKRAGEMHVAPSSDFYFVTNRRVMDVVCTLAYAAGLAFINESLGVDPTTGKLSDVSAAMVKHAILAPMRTIVLNDGTYKHASAIDVVVDQTNNILSTGELRITLRVTPNPIARTIEFDMAFKNPALA